MKLKTKSKIFTMKYVRLILGIKLPSYLVKSGAQRGYLKCSIRGTNNRLRNRFYKFVHLQLFNVKYNFVQFQLFHVKFLFSEKHSFANRRERLFMDARSQFRVLNSPGKMMTCYLRGTNKFLRYRTLHTSILKCGFPAKGIELTWLVLSKVLQMPQLRGTSVQTISVGTARKFQKYK